MAPDGSNELLLTQSVMDEAPSWGPDGQNILFNRTDPGSGRTKLFTVPVTGGVPRQIPTPQDGSDPSWSGARS
jgi:TolB protein